MGIVSVSLQAYGYWFSLIFDVFRDNILSIHDLDDEMALGLHSRETTPAYSEGEATVLFIPLERNDRELALLAIVGDAIVFV